MKKINITNGKILIDGVETRIISGALHYFRVHPDLWDDRLDKAVAFGLNTIETYVAWNLHEPHSGEYCFDGIANLEKFIDKVHERKLNMILRPGPYICAEWDNGGFPGWLMALPGIQLRRMNKPYLEAVTRWFDVLLPKLRKKCCTNGGPVIMMQVENEYGSYGHDKEYLRYIVELFIKHNIDVPYFTSDGAMGHYILGGTTPEALMTLNFGSDPAESFACGRKYRPEGPDFCMEFWNGWFDHWTEKHHVRPDDASEVFEKMISSGANVNFYMFHGGTNFGFTNGANGNFGNEYQPTVTSYDYDCPLNESGDPTPKFFAIQKIIAKYTGNPAIKEILPGKKICPAPVTLTHSAPVLKNLTAISTSNGQALTPPTMEELGENFGFIHYRTRIDGPMISAAHPDNEKEILRLLGVNDFALVWLNGEFLGSRWREEGYKEFILPDIPESGAILDILVENCGRINYGPKVGKDFKGITNGVVIGLQFRFNWEYNLLPLEDLNGLSFDEFENSAAVFHRGTFELSEIGDTFLKCPGTKGAVWINGFNLGRYWSVGPTETLYVPSPVLKPGKNEIIVLELEKLDSGVVEFSPEAHLGPTDTGDQA